jgi:hypothetical protein
MPALTSTDKFVIRVIKALVTAPLNAWANSYEFQSDDPVGVGELSTLASAVALFEQTIHRSSVQFNRVLVSSWAPDSKPYDPSVFLTIPLTGLGLDTSEGEQLALNQCLRLARVPETGKNGHLFYRACLEESSVSAPAGISVLTDVGVKDTQIQDALASSELEGYIGTTPLGPLHMVMISKSGLQVRPIISLTVQGVSTVSTDHAWFNRTTP